MGWYLGVIGKLHNDEYLIYIFTGEFLNGTPKIFNKLQYHFWYKESKNQFLTVFIDTTQKMFIFKLN